MPTAFLPSFLLVWGILSVTDSWVLVRSTSKTVNSQIGLQQPNKHE